MRYSTVGTWALVGTAAGVICLAAAYNMLHRAADPTYGEDGEIVDAGADLTKSSAQTSMAKDMLWACVILLPPLGISDYAWIVAFCVPLAFGWQAYRTISNSFQGLSGQGAAPPRSQKAEKRAERRRVKRL
jgi:cobalamin synthase